MERTPDYPPTLFLIKPDGVRRRLIGEIVGRIEATGLTIHQMVRCRLTTASAQALYVGHLGEAYFERLVETLVEDTLMALAISGPDAVARLRALQGPAFGALPGTIRGDFMLERPYTVTHTSDSPEEAHREMLLFSDFGILKY